MLAKKENYYSELFKKRNGVYATWLYSRCGNKISGTFSSLFVRPVLAVRCYTSAACAVMQCLSVRPSVCLSFCLSVAFMNSVKTNKHVFKMFSPSGSHIILVSKCHGNIPTGTPPLSGTSNRGGIGDSRPICGSIACCERLNC